MAGGRIGAAVGREWTGGSGRALTPGGGFLVSADSGGFEARQQADAPSDELVSALKQAKLDLLEQLSAIHASTDRGHYTEETAAKHIKEAYEKFEARIQQLLEGESHPTSVTLSNVLPHSDSDV